MDQISTAQDYPERVVPLETGCHTLHGSQRKYHLRPRTRRRQAITPAKADTWIGAALCLACSMDQHGLPVRRTGSLFSLSYRKTPP